jgi:hypothetical protein
MPGTESRIRGFGLGTWDLRDTVCLYIIARHRHRSSRIDYRSVGTEGAGGVERFLCSRGVVHRGIVVSVSSRRRTHSLSCLHGRISARESDGRRSSSQCLSRFFALIIVCQKLHEQQQLQSRAGIGRKKGCQSIKRSSHPTSPTPRGYRSSDRAKKAQTHPSRYCTVLNCT